MAYDLKNPISADYFASGTSYRIPYGQKRRFAGFEDSSGNYHRDVSYNKEYEVSEGFHGGYESSKSISIGDLPVFSAN